MQYFSTLPIFDNKYRNIFKKVSLSFIQKDQLIKYQMDDFESLAIVSQKYYNNHEYWWVIALLNHIYDINIDVPFPDSQAEIIAKDIAMERFFDDCVIESDYSKIDASETSKSIVFDNPSNFDFMVLLSVLNDSFIDVKLSYQPIANNSFVVSLDNVQGVDLDFGYSIIRKPPRLVQLDYYFFSDVYDKLIREIDQKREIYLLKQEHLYQFLAKYQTALVEENLSIDETYLTEINLLIDEPDIPISRYNYGVLIDYYKNIKFGGSSYYRQINVPFYEYNHVSLITPRTLNDAGNFGVRQRLNLPRVYNDGGQSDRFDVAVFSKVGIANTANSSIFDVGVSNLVAGENIITFDNIDPENTDIEKLMLFGTPIINTTAQLTNLTPIAFEHNDLDSVKVHCDSDFTLGWIAMMKKKINEVETIPNIFCSYKYNITLCPTIFLYTDAGEMVEEAVDVNVKLGYYDLYGDEGDEGEFYPLAKEFNFTSVQGFDPEREHQAVSYLYGDALDTILFEEFYNAEKNQIIPPLLPNVYQIQFEYNGETYQYIQNLMTFDAIMHQTVDISELELSIFTDGVEYPGFLAHCSSTIAMLQGNSMIYLVFHVAIQNSPLSPLAESYTLELSGQASINFEQRTWSLNLVCPEIEAGVITNGEVAANGVIDLMLPVPMSETEFDPPPMGPPELVFWRTSSLQGLGQWEYNDTTYTQSLNNLPAICGTQCVIMVDNENSVKVE